MHSFAIQPFKIVLMIPSSCYQIKSPFFLNSIHLFLFFPSHLLTRTTLFWRGLLNSVTLTKIKLPWITSNYKTMQRLKAKKRSQSPPLPSPSYPILILDISSLQTRLKKIVCYYKRRVWNTVKSTNIKIFHPCDQRCCS